MRRMRPCASDARFSNSGAVRAQQAVEARYGNLSDRKCIGNFPILLEAERAARRLNI